MKPTDTLPPLDVDVLIEVEGRWRIGQLVKLGNPCELYFWRGNKTEKLANVSRWCALPVAEGDERKWWAWAGDEWVQLASVNSPVVLEYYSRILRFCPHKPTSPPTAEELARIGAKEQAK